MRDRVTGEFLWGEHVHFTSRPIGGEPDPHLHAHCFVLNQTFDTVENRWKALQLGDIKRDAPLFEARFHSRMSLAPCGTGSSDHAHGEGLGNRKAYRGHHQRILPADGAESKSWRPGKGSPTRVKSRTGRQRRGSGSKKDLDDG